MSERVTQSLALAFVLAAVTLAYHQSLDGALVSDDLPLLVGNPKLAEGAPLTGFFSEPFFSRPDAERTAAYYRPLTSVSYALDTRLWGGSARGFHGTNLILHLACSSLVFGLALRVTGGATVAALAALGFGLFPRSSESVAWVSGRTDILATLGVLAALALHDARPGAAGRRIAAALALGAGLLAKEVALAGFVALIAYEATALRRSTGEPGNGLRRVLLNLAPAIAVVAVYGAVRASVTGFTVGPDPFGFALRTIFVFQALGTYGYMLATPLHPSAIIGKLGVVDSSLVFAGTAVASLLVAAAGYLGWRRPGTYVFASFALVGVPLALVCHAIPLPLPAVAADRFLYLPAAGLALLAAEGASRLEPRTARVAGTAGIVLAMTFGVATFARVPDWGEPVRFWEVTARDAPALAPEPFKELGTLYAWEGDSMRALESYIEALRRESEFARSFPARRVDPQLRSNTALVLSEVGRYEVASQMLEQLVREEPEHAERRLHLGAVYARQLDFNASERELATALEIYPGYPLARTILNQVERAEGIWSDLPEETEDEPLETRTARAEVYELVGRLGDADSMWWAVARADEASVAEVVRAASYLVLRGGNVEAAREALARLRALDADHRALPRLERSMATRIGRASL